MRDFIVASELQEFLREDDPVYDLPGLESDIDATIKSNSVVWCGGFQRLVPWFTESLEEQYQDSMRGRYAERLRASMIFLAVFFVVFVGYEYVRDTDRFYVTGFARLVCALGALLLAVLSRSVLHGGYLSSKLRYMCFSTFVIMFAAGSTMALAVIDQDMRPPVDLLIVMTGMYGIAAAPFARLTLTLCISTAVWNLYLAKLGAVYHDELLASVIALWTINLMGALRSWQAEFISRQEVFGESKRFALQRAMREFTKREASLVRAFTPGFLQQSTIGQAQTFENASFGLVLFPFLEEMMRSDESAPFKRQRLAGIMTIVDQACAEYGIRRIVTHSQFMAFVSNVPTTRCTGHAPMFCAMAHIVTNLHGSMCAAVVSDGLLDCTLVGTLCRSVAFGGQACDLATQCLTLPSVVMMESDECALFVTPKVKVDVLSALHLHNASETFVGCTDPRFAACINPQETADEISAFVQSRPRSTQWKIFSQHDDDNREDCGLLVTEFESSNGSDEEFALVWTRQERARTTDPGALIVNQARSVRRRRNLARELWSHFRGLTRFSHRIVRHQGFEEMRVNPEAKPAFWDQYRRRHWVLMMFWFGVGMLILASFAGLDAKVFPTETKDSNFVRLLGGPLFCLLFAVAFKIAQQSSSSLVYLVPLGWAYVVYLIVFVLYVVSPPEDTLYGGPRLFTVIAFAVFGRIPLPYFVFFLPLPIGSYWVARFLDDTGVDRDGRPLVDTSMELAFQLAAATFGAAVVSILDWWDDERYFLKTLAYAWTITRRGTQIDNLRDQVKNYSPRPMIDVLAKSSISSNEVIEYEETTAIVFVFPHANNIEETARVVENIDNAIGSLDRFEKVCFVSDQYWIRASGNVHSVEALLRIVGSVLPHETRYGVGDGTLYICALGIESTTIGVWGSAVHMASENLQQL